MSTLTSTPHDSLPYIDPPPTPSQRAAAESLVTAHLPLTHHNTPHPSLPTLPQEPTSKPTTLFSSFANYNSPNPPSKTKGGVDMSRYEPIDPTSIPSLSSSTTDPKDTYRDLLRSASTLSTHLSTRRQNLQLLSAHGKNTHLLLNHLLEAELSALENKVAEVDTEIEAVNRERRQRQEDVRGEVESLEGSWRDGVRRGIEVEVENQRLRSV